MLVQERVKNIFRINEILENKCVQMNSICVLLILLATPEHRSTTMSIDKFQSLKANYGYDIDKFAEYLVDDKPESLSNEEVAMWVKDLLLINMNAYSEMLNEELVEYEQTKS